MRLSSLLVSLCFATLIAGPVHAAWPFGGDKNDAAKKPPSAVKRQPLAGAIVTADTDTQSVPYVKRAHLRFEDSKMETDFLQLVAIRQRTQDDLLVITRLIDEKEKEVDKFESDLEKEFGISPKGNYRYDSQLTTIFELIPKSQSASDRPSTVTDVASWEAQFTRREHKKLDTEASRKRFMELAQAKQLSTDQLRMLDLLKSEKHLEEARLQQELTHKFAISNDRNYQYDADTKNLFELVPVPLVDQQTALPDGKEAVPK